MSDTARKLACYIVHPTQVERIDDNGDSLIFDEPSLYDDLVLAGYPLTNDASLGGYFIDLMVDEWQHVIVNTSYPAVEHDMGAAAGLFLAWRVLCDHEPDPWDDPPTGTNRETA